MISGWNKLYGWADMNNHENSVRIAWYCNNGKIILGYYCYMDGILYNGAMDTTTANVINHGSTKYEAGQYWVTVNDKTVTLKNASAPDIILKEYPYFGGQSTAPHEMDIYIKEW